MLPSLKIQDKLRALSVYERNIIWHRFPKNQTYNYLKDAILSTTEKIRFLLCKVKKNYFKKSTLEDVDTELELLREYIRECCDDPKISINFKSAQFWISCVDEIGAMIGSWLKRETTSSKYKKDASVIPGLAPFITEEDLSDHLYIKEEKLTESDIYVNKA